MIINNERNKSGIGTLGEKTLHAILKHYFEPDERNHETKIGKYYADIVNENGIIEIQTRNFNALRLKLSAFLENSEVTIVYPIAHQKWLIWIDNETGEITKKRKSPKVGRLYEAFFELYKIKPLLTHPNLKLCIVMLDMTEYRNLDGWSGDKKKGSSRYERIPNDIVDEIHIDSAADYIKLIPLNLPENFTSKDFQKESGLNLHNAQTALNVLKYVGGVYQTGRQGNSLIYKKQPIVKI